MELEDDRHTLSSMNYATNARKQNYCGYEQDLSVSYFVESSLGRLD